MAAELSIIEQYQELRRRNDYMSVVMRGAGLHIPTAEGTWGGYIGSPEELRESARALLGQPDDEGLGYLVELEETSAS